MDCARARDGTCRVDWRCPPHRWTRAGRVRHRSAPRCRGGVPAGWRGIPGLLRTGATSRQSRPRCRPPGVAPVAHRVRRETKTSGRRTPTGRWSKKTRRSPEFRTFFFFPDGFCWILRRLCTLVGHVDCYRCRTEMLRIGYELRPVRLLRHLIRESQGQDLIEYALLIAIVSLGLISVVGPVAEKVSTFYSATSGALADDSGGNQGNGQGNGQ